MDDQLEAVLRAGSKSFHTASKLLPRRVRGPTLALYAFCREADDAVDGADGPSSRRAAVDTLARRVESIYRGRALDTVAMRAFARVVETFRIPRAVPEALIEGMRWDADGKTYVTIEDVRAYGMRVAGTVGMMMTLVMGKHEPVVLGRACDLGMAMQLTNIARDVGEDARMGRVYLPSAWLQARGIEPEELLRLRTPTDGLRDAVASLLDEAERLYARADEGIPHLPADCRVSIRAARLVYAEIGNVVRARGFDSISRRAVVSIPRKLWLVLRSVGALTWPPRALSSDVSDEARALVASMAPAPESP